MRVAAHHRSLGDEIELRWTHNSDPQLWDAGTETVYASTIFERTRPHAEHLLTQWPDAHVGGTGWDVASSLEEVGIETLDQDYSLYPKWRQSIGFTQRGCRLRCKFCVVPRKEGAIRFEKTIAQIWRGDPWPRELLLLDNDFFGQEAWRDRIAEIHEGHFAVSFCQGINARFLTEDAAQAIGSIDYRDDQMRVKRMYTAWDNLKDEHRLFDGLQRLVKHGVRAAHIMVYMLIGYWPGETMEENLYRARKLREFGAFPYPMPFVRTRELVGFQRWIIGAYDKRVPWEDWKRGGYRPERLGLVDDEVALKLTDE